MTDDRESSTTNAEVVALRRSGEPRLRLLIVEDQRRILDRQRKLLENHQDVLEIVGTARNGMDAVEHCAALRPDVMLLDLGLPDIDGIEVTRRVRDQCPDTEILIFTIFDEEERVLEAVRAGASGYLLKGAPAQRIVEALFDVHRGGSVIQPQLARALLRRFQTPAGAKTALTPRETEILNLIAKGLSNREAADALGLSRATVRTHLEHIYAKLDVSNRTEAVTEAIRRGIIEP
ncbi:MAG: response regulator transcription factor [Deltaproteobacteria bacterium]|nr:response regulator transcription factor [Deltaproteobacteria bacterium]